MKGHDELSLSADSLDSTSGSADLTLPKATLLIPPHLGRLTLERQKRIIAATIILTNRSLLR
jgi:hypothetical protein